MGLIDRLLTRLSGLPAASHTPALPQVKRPAPPPLPAATVLPPRTASYRHSLDQPLLSLSRRDQWTIRDSFEGTQIFGETGSGKTSGSGAALARSFLRADYGGLVLTFKADECTRWVQYAREAGRLDSLLIVGKDEPWRFNFLEYQYLRADEGAGHTENTVSAFMNILESRYRGGQRQTREEFFTDGARQLLYFGLELLAAAGEPVSMHNLFALIRSTPYAERDSGTILYPQGSYCLACLQKAQAGGQPLHHIVAFLEGELARPGAARESSAVIRTLTTMAHPLTTGLVSDLLCTETNFLPDYSRAGAIIILNLPLEVWEDVGRTAQLLFKYIWQRAMLRFTGIRRGGHPVFLWVDEAQAFVTDYDRMFQEGARSACAATVYLTQSVSNFRAALGDNADAKANALLGNLATKIFHRNSDFTTNQWAAEMIAKGVIVRYSGGYAGSDSQSFGFSAGENSGWSAGSSQGGSNSSHSGGSSSGINFGRSTSTSQNQGWHQTVDYLVQPGVFTRLKGGGPEHAYHVQGVVFKAGKRWKRTGHTFLDVTFPQR